MIPLTLLYVPAARPDRFAKAAAAGADVVIIDLEDAVSPSCKDEARRAMAEALAGPAPSLAAGGARGGAAEGGAGGVAEGGAGRIQVRINAEGSPWFADDCAALADLDPAVEARIPKAESAEQVRRIAERLPGRRLHLLVESAAGLEHAGEIAAAHDRVASLALGESDLRSDLRTDSPRAMAWARMRVLVAARAAGLPSPSMSVYPHVTDLEGLAADCREGAALGFVGRAAIHPRQLATIVEAFRPGEAEVERARAVIAQVRDAQSRGSGVVVTADGAFLDAAMVSAAKAVLARAAAGGR